MATRQIFPFFHNNNNNNNKKDSSAPTSSPYGSRTSNQHKSHPRTPVATKSSAAAAPTMLPPQSHRSVTTSTPSTTKSTTSIDSGRPFVSLLRLQRRRRFWLVCVALLLLLAWQSQQSVSLWQQPNYLDNVSTAGSSSSKLRMEDAEASLIVQSLAHDSSSSSSQRFLEDETRPEEPSSSSLELPHVWLELLPEFAARPPPSMGVHHRLAVCTSYTDRHDGGFLDEWLDYHVALGMDVVLWPPLLPNQRHPTILQTAWRTSLQRTGRLHLVNHDNDNNINTTLSSPHIPALHKLCHAWTTEHRYEWAAVLQVHEFIVVPQLVPRLQLLERNPTAFTLPDRYMADLCRRSVRPRLDLHRRWFFENTDNQKKNDDGPITQRFHRYTLVPQQDDDNVDTTTTTTLSPFVVHVPDWDVVTTPPRRKMSVHEPLHVMRVHSYNHNKATTLRRDQKIDNDNSAAAPMMMDASAWLILQRLVPGYQQWAESNNNDNKNNNDDEATTKENENDDSDNNEETEDSENDDSDNNEETEDSENDDSDNNNEETSEDRENEENDEAEEVTEMKEVNSREFFQEFFYKGVRADRRKHRKRRKVVYNYGNYYGNDPPTTGLPHLYFGNDFPEFPKRPPPVLPDPPGRDRVALCAHVKNESLYLDEWADYHVALGFDLFVSDNADVFGLGSWRTDLQRRERLFLRHVPGEAAQSLSYQACHRIVRRQGYTWVAFFDVDEFLVLPHILTSSAYQETSLLNDAGDSIVVEFCRRYVPPRRHLAVLARIFGTNNQTHYQPLPVTQRFPTYSVNPLDSSYWRFKTMARVQDLIMTQVPSPHHFYSPRHVWRINTRGQRVGWKDENGPTNVARLHHYKFKSQDEYVVKKLRGRGFSGGTTPWNGDPLPPGHLWDPTAWQILQLLVPSYRRFPPAPEQPIPADTTTPQRNMVEQQEQQQTLVSADPRRAPGENGNPKEWMLVGFNHSLVVNLDFDARLAAKDSDKPDMPHLYLDQTPVFSSEPGGRVAVCAHSKNETLYIDEWADYHLALGFDLYITDNTDEFELEHWRRQAPHNARVFVTHLPGEAMQRYAYKACYQHVFDKNYKWVAFFDLDEFLVLPAVLKTQGTMTSFSIPVTHSRQYGNPLPPPESIMEDFCRRYVRPFRPLGVVWKIFGTSNHQQYEKRPVVQRFQRPIQTDLNSDWKIKTIAMVGDLNMTTVISPHKFALSSSRTLLINTRRQVVGSSNKYGPTDVARFHHYKFKSVEEHVVKRRRGRGFSGGVRHLETALLGLDKDGKPLPAGVALRDATAWQILKKLVPEYQAWERKIRELSRKETVDNVPAEAPTGPARQSVELFRAEAQPVPEYQTAERKTVELYRAPERGNFAEESPRVPARAAPNEGEQALSVPKVVRRRNRHTRFGLQNFLSLWPDLVEPYDEAKALPHIYFANPPEFPPNNGKDGRDRVALCAHSKNETLYIDEWADYYLALGFDLFITDNTDEYELRHWRRGPQYSSRIEIRHIRGEAVQADAYRGCHARVKHLGYTWVAFFDLDEFLVFPALARSNLLMTNFSGHSNNQPPPSIIVDFCRKYVPPRRHRLIVWRVFGTGNHQHYEKLPVTQRFQYHAFNMSDGFWKVKTIARVEDLNMIEVYSPHRFRGNSGSLMMDTNDKIFRHTQHVGGPVDVARIHHYKYKSVDEHVTKRRRSRGFSGGVRHLDTALLGLDKDGKPLPPGETKDPFAWDILKRLVPEYAVFETNIAGEGNLNAETI